MNPETELLKASLINYPEEEVTIDAEVVITPEEEVECIEQVISDCESLVRALNAYKKTILNGRTVNRSITGRNIRDRVALAAKRDRANTLIGSIKELQAIK